MIEVKTVFQQIVVLHTVIPDALLLFPACLISAAVAILKYGLKTHKKDCFQEEQKDHQPPHPKDIQPYSVRTHGGKLGEKKFP